jgi:hypothetical protein
MIVRTLSRRDAAMPSTQASMAAGRSWPIAAFQEAGWDAVIDCGTFSPRNHGNDWTINRISARKKGCGRSNWTRAQVSPPGICAGLG